MKIALKIVLFWIFFHSISFSQNSVLYKEIHSMLKSSLACESCQFDISIKMWMENTSVLPDKNFDVHYEIIDNQYYVSFDEITYVNSKNFKLVAIKADHTIFLDSDKISTRAPEMNYSIESIANSFDKLDPSYRIVKKVQNGQIIYYLSFPAKSPILNSSIYFSNVDQRILKITYNYNEDYHQDYPNKTELTFGPLSKLMNHKHFNLLSYIYKSGSTWKGKDQFRNYNIETNERHEED